jgi:DNA-binding NarL/FixJ family response regulator
MSVTVLIADHQDVMRAGLKSMLAKSAAEVVAEADNPKEMMRLIKKHEPHVLVLDVRFAGDDGFEVLADIKRRHPSLPVLVWSTGDNPTYVCRAIALGADGYLPRGLDRADLLAVLRQVAAGRKAWTKEQLATFTGAPEPHDRIDVHLTPREREVLRQLAYGLPNKEIALALGISFETVKEHIQHILRKLKYTDRTEAAVWAVRNGMA